ncbi:MAG: T9SS type A sorting domain-containing protein [Saprospiraceae bacterium]
MKNLIFLFFAVVVFQFKVDAQCFPKRHSTNFFDGWISCEPAQSPNPDRPVSHFIMYDFGKTFKLGQMEIWNSNDPAHLDRGMRDVAIDYSIDGVTWQTAGDFTFQQASGLSTYEGGPGPDLGGVEGRYLLITAINNYGGDCYGLSEFRIDGEEVVITDVHDVAKLDCIDISIYPNPFAEKMSLVLAPGCSGELRYTLYDALGQMVSSEKTKLISGQEKTVEIGRSLPAGTYMIHIEFGGKSINHSLIKMSKA